MSEPDERAEPAATARTGAVLSLIHISSRELGYASDEGFSRAFRRRTGVTPSAWRTAAPASVPA